jgi:hypothetical protein
MKQSERRNQFSSKVGFNQNRIQRNSSISEVASPLKENFSNSGLEEIKFS